MNDEKSHSDQVGRMLIIGCERHVDRLISVNLERQGHICASAPSMDAIAEVALRLSPTVAIVDDSRIASEDVLTELTKAGFGDIPIIKLSDQSTNPPLKFPLR